MSVVTFWSNGKEQTGKTISVAAIATYVSIQHNIKVLVVSTSDNDETLQNCFVKKHNSKSSLGMFAPKSSGVAMQNGMNGLVKMAKSNKVTPEIIRNYTRVIFNEALEILYGGSTEVMGEDMSQYYPDIISAANQYYDLVLVDLDTNIDPEIQRTIMKNSNIIVANVNQRLTSIDRFVEERKNDDILSSKKTLILLGRYDRFSRYSSKNVTRYMGEKKEVLTMPYNTLLFDMAEEAGVPDYFLNFVRNSNLDKDDRNYLFFQEIKRAVDAIQYRIQELQMKY